jgi:para-aminobenzoate synthetase component I
MTAASFTETVAFDDWQRWQQQGCTRLPVVLVRRDEMRPESWAGFTDATATVLLESAQSGRYSYLCDRPSRLILGDAAHADIWSPNGETLLGQKSGRPLEVLEEIFRANKTPSLPGWPAMCGGMIGVFGYDLVRTWERLPLRARRDLTLPLYALIETGELFIYDHGERTLRVVIWSDVTTDAQVNRDAFRAAGEKAGRAYARWQSGGGAPIAASKPAGGKVATASPADSASFTGEEFQAAARRALDYIGAGDTYQVNLSRRTSRATSLPPEVIYEALRRVNPSPYMGLLRLPQFALVCGSPELLVRLVDGVVSSRPIAGTRPRGDAAAEDSHLSAELFASAKERAEHLMLVDLIRNDIGRVAEFGSVQVPEFMMLERYSHVMHIVSQVEGRLAAGKTWADVLRSLFPGGTITGCPKFRTMEIIEELEPVGRGYYTGALGWISYGGEMELNIVIRSMLVQDGVAHVQAGSGIVADSQPARELDEATRKAQALWVALENATKRHG